MMKMLPEGLATEEDVAQEKKKGKNPCRHNMPPLLLLGLLFPPSAAAGVVTVVHSHPTPVIDRATAAKFGVKGGFETGNALKLNGTYHLFYGERAPPTTYPWKMGWTTQIGHWTSPDGLACEPHPLPPPPPEPHSSCGLWGPQGAGWRR